MNRLQYQDISLLSPNFQTGSKPRQSEFLISPINIQNHNDAAIYNFFPIDKNAIARLDIRLIKLSNQAPQLIVYLL